MRVIAGSARRLLLVTPKDLETRPTTDRIKETLFNMIQFDIPGCVFLDLFAGSGGIGIEALSRGASRCYFADRSQEASACIRTNLKTTHFEDQGVLIKGEAGTALDQIGRSEKHADFVFLDPPYGQGLEVSVFQHLAKSHLVDEDTVMILETLKEVDLGYLDTLGFLIDKTKSYGKIVHVFIKKQKKGEL